MLRVGTAQRPLAYKANALTYVKLPEHIIYDIIINQCSLLCPGTIPSQMVDATRYTMR